MQKRRDTFRSLLDCPFRTEASLEFAFLLPFTFGVFVVLCFRRTIPNGPGGLCPLDALLDKEFKHMLPMKTARRAAAVSSCCPGGFSTFTAVYILFYKNLSAEENLIG